jgi:hypothetical protein
VYFFSVVFLIFFILAWITYSSYCSGFKIIKQKYILRIKRHTPGANILLKAAGHTGAVGFEWSSSDEVAVCILCGLYFVAVMRNAAPLQLFFFLHF